MKRIGLLVFILLAGTGSAEVAEQCCTDSEAGITIRMPTGWHLQTAREIELNDKKLNHKDDRLKETGKLVRIKFSKYEEPTDLLNTSVQVGLAPLGAWAELGVRELAVQSLEVASESMHKFEFVGDPEEVRIDGHAAGFVAFRHELRTKDGLSYDVMTHMWVIPREAKILGIVMSGPTEEDEANQDLFGTILRSIRLEPR